MNGIIFEGYDTMTEYHGEPEADCTANEASTEGPLAGGAVVGPAGGTFTPASKDFYRKL